MGKIAFLLTALVFTSFGVALLIHMAVNPHNTPKAAAVNRVEAFYEQRNAEERALFNYKLRMYAAEKSSLLDQIEKTRELRVSLAKINLKLYHMNRTIDSIRAQYINMRDNQIKFYRWMQQ
jgi:hypothetical protein